MGWMKSNAFMVNTSASTLPLSFQLLKHASPRPCSPAATQTARNKPFRTVMYMGPMHITVQKHNSHCTMNTGDNPLTIGKKSNITSAQKTGWACLPV
jgi:hypothetical protein